MINVKILKEAAIVVTSVGVIFGALWTVGNATGYRPVLVNELAPTVQQLEALGNNFLLLKFQLLQEKRAQGGLLFNELQEYCRIARVLDFLAVDGCNATANGRAQPNEN